MNLATLRHVAPAGAPIGLLDLARWLAVLAGDRRPVETLRREVAARTGVQYCQATCTGRAAMTVVLRALKRARRDHRDEVIVPAYTCYSVAAAVVRAGLRPRIVDIDPATLDYEPVRLTRTDTSRALAIVATNLYGIPSDMPRLSAFARERRLALVDDAAQALGATVGGRHSGTWGDVGIYSLDKGKNLSAIDGGLIVSNNTELARVIESEMQGLPETPAGEVRHVLVKLGAYVLLLRPWLYWIPNGIPQLGLGQTVYDTSYAVHHYSPVLAALAVAMLRQLDRFTAARRANAAWLRQQLGGVKGIGLVTPPAGSEPAYVRFPLLVDDPGERDPLVARLNAAGIGATGSYPRSIADIDHLREYPADVNVPPGGAAVAARIVTLPTHPFVGRRDLARMAAVVQSFRGVAPAALPHRATA